MKKILTVSLFAMMAVSAANAEIASTDYVGKQITATAGTLTDLTTTEKGNLVGAINELKDDMSTMDRGYGTALDELSSSFTSYKSSNNEAVAAAKKAGDDAQADLNAYKTSNNTAVAAAKKAGDDAQADIDNYKSTNDAALALKANSADVYTKTEADTQFMDSTEVSTAITNAVTGAEGALKDYVTKTALEESQSEQDTTLKAYADSVAATAKSGAEATAASALNAYKTSNNTAVAAAKKAGDDAQADIDNYKSTNDAALALKANSADVYTKTQVYTKTEADTQFMDSTEVSTAITNAVTGAEGALKDYVTKTALEESQSEQDTTLKAYADSAAATAKSGAEATAASALNAYKTSNNTAVAAAKKAGDDAQADLNAYKTSNNTAVAAAKKAGDDAQATADTKQAKSTAMSIGAANGAWTDLTKATNYSKTGTFSLVLKDGNIAWEKVTY